MLHLRIRRFSDLTDALLRGLLTNISVLPFRPSISIVSSTEQNDNALCS